MAAILAELLVVGEESGRTARIRFKRREETTVGRKSVENGLLAPFKQEARDDILGGTPTMAIAGLLLASSFQKEAISPGQVPSVQNWTWAKQRPERQGDPGGGAEKLNAELQRNNREQKKGAAAIAFERKRGYKKKAQRKRAPTRSDWVGADATGVCGARL
jgi:hypothetical protein